MGAPEEKETGLFAQVLRYAESFKHKRKAMTRKERRNQNIFFGLIIVGVALIVFSCIGIVKGMEQVQQLEAQKAKVTNKKANLNDRIDELDRNVKLLKDPDYIEKVARERYFLSNDGELIFVFPDDSPSQEKQADNTGVQQSTRSSQSTVKQTSSQNHRSF